MFKIAVSFAVLAIVGAQYHHHEHEEHSAPAHYQFSYAVHDEHTGDIKSQQESRDGDVVHGRYELIDSDGYKRIVEYTADKHSGFNAVVHREPTDIKIPVYAAKAPAAIAHYAPAPVAHYAPAKVSQYVSSPVSNHFSSGTNQISTSHISQPVLKISKPVVPVHEYVSAPVVKYTSAPAIKISSAPSFGSFGKSSQHSYEPAHVTFSAPSVNYHY